MNRLVFGALAALGVAAILSFRRSGSGGAWEAAYRDNTAELQRLLATPGGPALVSATDEYGNTPLHWAAKGGALASIGVLMRAGANPLAANHAGSTPLHWACTVAASPADTDAARRLTPPHPTLTALLGAAAPAASGDDDAAVAAARAAVNAVNHDKETPLHWAVDWANEGAVALLLSRGADVAAADAHANTPLHRISAGCQDDIVCRRIVARLTRAGASITAANEFGRKPLDHFDLGKAPAESLPDDPRDPNADADADAADIAAAAETEADLDIGVPPVRPPRSA